MGDDEHHHEFESASGSGASATYPMQCSALRKNGHVVLKGRPCKIVEMSTSKTGKHGHAKVHLVGVDIFTNKKLEDISPSTHNMDVPHVTRTEFTVIDCAEDGYLSLMTSDGSTKDDVRIEKGSEMYNQIVSGIEEGKEYLVTVVSAMGEEAVAAFKEAPRS
ncbi:5327_t:CDS:2 [Funneliformis caledonium]|uniref:Eukaryotic translation initiation factor 5A n=2 Tax=Funneliformis TaxID=1117308 RepID=A0A9N8YUT3_9GLOM|nr:5327_t:CDS:2 [Funneliformis caledonium]CAG8483195.1 10024_t:CDS:2 [Funneliformis mosseae]